MSDSRGVPLVIEMDGGNDLVLPDFWNAARERGLNHMVTDQWPSTQVTVPEVAVASVGGKSYARYMVEHSSAGIGYVRTMEGQALVSAFGKSVSEARDVLTWIKEFQPLSEPKDGMIEVTFWSYGHHGPESSIRSIAAPSWLEIGGNYASAAAANLEYMMSQSFEPGVGGQLLLWNGPTGTGKTTALRGLAREWKDWCAIHYVTDPEKFFGSHASYMMEVLLDEQGGRYPVGGPGEFNLLGRDDESPRWRLLVLEDAGELLRKDAAEVTGKALSRMLNAVDGMIGQGLRILVLVTTNEDTGALHDAVARPGRCACEIKFERLNSEAANQWREAHSLPSGTSASLAELYAELEGFKGAADTRMPLGFGREDTFA